MVSLEKVLEIAEFSLPSVKVTYPENGFVHLSQEIIHFQSVFVLEAGMHCAN